MLEKLAHARSKLGPKLRVLTRAHSCLGSQYSYSLGARDFGARPIPSGKVLIFDGNIHPCHELVCNKLKACVYTKIMTKIFIEF